MGETQFVTLQHVPVALKCYLRDREDSYLYIITQIYYNIYLLYVFSIIYLYLYNLYNYYVIILLYTIIYLLLYIYLLHRYILISISIISPLCLLAFKSQSLGRMATALSLVWNRCTQFQKLIYMYRKVLHSKQPLLLLLYNLYCYSCCGGSLQLFWYLLCNVTTPPNQL